MTYHDGALHCDKPFCTETLAGPRWEALEAARVEGWHTVPCFCPWRSVPRFKWKHDNDYCPDHFPVQRRRYIENVRSPLL
jgi:hypothetical protein